MSIDEKKVTIGVAIGVAIEKLDASQRTTEKIKTLYAQMGFDGIFGRSDIANIIGGSVTSAGKLISKLKEASLIEAVSGHGKGKYRFVNTGDIDKKVFYTSQ